MDCALEVLEEGAQGKGADEPVDCLRLVEIIALFPHTLAFLLLPFLLLSLLSLELLLVNNLRLDQNMTILLLHRSHKLHNLRQLPPTHPFPILKRIHIIFIGRPKNNLVLAAAELVVVEFCDLGVDECVL